MRDLLTPAEPKNTAWNPLRALVGDIEGTVVNYPELRWREGIEMRLAWAADQLWLLLDPRTLFENITPSNKSAAADFARERSVRRYNRKLNDLISFWAGLLAEDGASLRTFGIADGVDAVFRLSSTTGFSWRCQP